MSNIKGIKIPIETSDKLEIEPDKEDPHLSVVKMGFRKDTFDLDSHQLIRTESRPYCRQAFPARLNLT